uniref:Uncharacterized protein n=1 Tax=Nelumbo nucifera TaxID=4432 RepID=A0A822Y564_NELNU|nr:TPA_asm: hypothetical protein HUJ06_029065 [Nelumbo nucifera]
MSETEEKEFIFHETRSLCSLKTLFHSSFNVFRDNPRLFISIFALTTFPLSLLFFCSSLYSRQLKDQIYSLEALALLKESRADSLTLLRLKTLFFLPSYVLSVLATITSVNSMLLAYSGRRPSCRTAVTAILMSWKRPLVTSIYVFIIMVAYDHVPRTISAMVADNSRSRWLVAVIGLIVDEYLRAVLSSAVVVSVTEERLGWEAVKAGWWMVEEKRFWLGFWFWLRVGV